MEMAAIDVFLGVGVKRTIHWTNENIQIPLNYSRKCLDWISDSNSIGRVQSYFAAETRKHHEILQLMNVSILVNMQMLAGINSLSASQRDGRDLLAIE